MSDHEAMLEKLQKIFAPPTAESLGKKALAGIPPAPRTKKQSDFNQDAGISSISKVVNAYQDDPGWRKPRPNTHDYCDSCNCTEGDRLVCDRCPASFHLECLDPPMDPQSAPTGIWYCHRCTMLSKEEEAQEHESNASGNSEGKNYLKNNGQNASEDVLSPLNFLLRVNKYWRMQNPKEFSLPKELLPAIKLPGSYKSRAERKANPIIEMENGYIPTPIRRCYNCAETCMKRPLLPCDYCTACFHLECLDPPMAAFPPRSDYWMCPLHSEHVVDKCLVPSIRLSDRIRAWNQLAVTDPDAPIDFVPNNPLGGASHEIQFTTEDEKAIISGFLKRVTQRKLEANAAKEVLGEALKPQPISPALQATSAFTCKRIVVPNAVKELYKNPVHRLPRPNEIFRGRRSLLKSQPKKNLTPTVVSTDQPLPATKEEQNAFIRGLLEFYIREDLKPSDASSASETTPNHTDDEETTSKSSITPSPDESNFDSIPTGLKRKIVDALQEIDNRITSDGTPKDLVEQDEKLLAFMRRRVQFSDGPIRACRAALIPCAGTHGPIVAMTNRQLTIGTGPGCHLDLSNYRVNSLPPCPKVSSNHASLFYDEYSRQFELLNYSEFGSTVDCIPFNNDYSVKHREQTEASRALCHARRIAEDMENLKSPTPKRPKFDGPSRIEAVHHCTDDDRSANEFGWEGSAVLHHGSVLRFGCYTFTFSIVEWFYSTIASS
ncbi:unnamed protein product [Rodentolepis nana]|uniref:PHD-type domain-containing protein n=1 Tax=Rodentolepis nana TaxID=102285 RepID=A0A0R3TM22_RODNA|nr:unnamed protein product [Rodentolepis nana]